MRMACKLSLVPSVCLPLHSEGQGAREEGSYRRASREVRKKRLFKARRALSEESGKGSVSRCRRMKKRSSGGSGGWEGKVHKVNNEKKIYRCLR